MERAKNCTLDPWDVAGLSADGPRVLGQYELLAPVGAGGMGRVYKARHLRMKRVVALKVLAPELLLAGPTRTLPARG